MTSILHTMKAGAPARWPLIAVKLNLDCNRCPETLTTSINQSITDILLSNIKLKNCIAIENIKYYVKYYK